MGAFKDMMIEEEDLRKDSDEGQCSFPAFDIPEEIPFIKIETLPYLSEASSSY